jgi:P4 family phage/plasmid primase-like protien
MSCKKLNPKNEKTLPEKSLVSQNKNIVNNMDDELHPTLQWYNKMKFVYYSGNMTMSNKSGEWKKWLIGDNANKDVKFSWKDPKLRMQLNNKSGYAILTGNESKISVIDIDDSTLEHNKKLMEVMKYCNTIAITKPNHYHYYFKYNPKLKNTQDSELSLDIRNDGGLIYAPPTYYRDRNNEMKEVVYKFMKKDNNLLEVSQEIIDCLQSIKKDYYIINHNGFIDDDEEEKPKKKEKKEIKVDKIDNVKLNNKIVSLLNLLNDKRCDEYTDWINIGMICYNEGLLKDEWIEWSKKSDKFDLNECNRQWSHFRLKDKKLGLGTLCKMVKEDKKDAFKKWQVEYNETDDCFNKKLQTMCHADWANIYYTKNKNKYIVSKTKEWYEYDKYNVLINQNGVPSSLLNDITDTLQAYLIEKRNNIMPVNDDGTPNEYHNAIMALIKKNYVNLGSFSYGSGIIKYLEQLYMNLRLDDLIDANINVLAFDNKIFDIKLKDFRPIEATDYITKTTKTKAPTIDEDFKECYYKKINKLLLSIFNTKEQVDYWLKITSLSLFTNKFESLYLLCGSGGNGKGVLSNILVKILGEYMYIANNTFLTEKIKGGQANSTLAKCRGVRYLLVSEPDDGSNDAEFNVEFIKQITGNDPITTRDLYKSNMTFYPQLTPFVQCNKKPRLGKIDGGIQRRLKIHNYPNKFVSNPTKENEKKIDTSLKTSMDDNFYNYFMLLLLETARDNIDLKQIDQPKCNEDETNEYFNENNPVKNYIDMRLTYKKDAKIKLKDAYDDFRNKFEDNMTMKRFKEELIRNELIVAKKSDIYIINIEFIKETKEKEFLDDDEAKNPLDL